MILRRDLLSLNEKTRSNILTKRAFGDCVRTSPTLEWRLNFRSSQAISRMTPADDSSTSQDRISSFDPRGEIPIHQEPPHEDH